MYFCCICVSDCSEKHDRFSAVAPKITLNTLAVETGI